MIAFQSSHQQPKMTLIQSYTLDLVSSGRDDAEIVDGLEQYYSKLGNGFDEELAKLNAELELHKAAARELEAQEIILPASENDDLSNYFLECIYQQRKSLRHQLLTMRNNPVANNSSAQNTSQAKDPNMSYMSKTSTAGGTKKTISNVFNNSLLNIYINTVKTGSQQEIEQFSQIEKQKLVQLLSTNNELLTYIFDKMFKNMKKQDKSQARTTRGGDINNLQRSQAEILHALLNLDTPPAYDTVPNEGQNAFQSFNNQAKN